MLEQGLFVLHELVQAAVELVALRQRGVLAQKIAESARGPPMAGAGAPRCRDRSAGSKSAFSGRSATRFPCGLAADAPARRRRAAIAPRDRAPASRSPNAAGGEARNP